MKRRTPPFAIAAAIGVGLLVALLAYGVVSSKPDRSIDQALADGQRPAAPSLTLDRLSGEGRVALEDYRGKVVVVNIWTSWCEPCREESPMLQRWHERISKGGGGTVLGIDVVDVTSDARAFVAEYELTYPMLRDRDGESLEAFSVISYPETFVIDRGGRIAAARRGVVDEEFMREHVAPLVERS